MPELPSILIAGLTGLISGVLLSIPVGPVNLTILNEGARRGFKWKAGTSPNGKRSVSSPATS